MKNEKDKGAFFLFILGAALFFYPLGAFSEETNLKERRERAAKVTFLQGKAEALPKGEVSWSPLRVGSLIFPDDEIRSLEKSRLEIQFPDHSILRFDEQTNFKIKKSFFDASTNSRQIKVEMALGKSWANVRKIFGAQKTFELASANAVAGVRDTIWRMNVEPDQATLIKVYEGVVQIYNPFAQLKYKPGEEGLKDPHEVIGPHEVPRPYREVTREEWEEIVLRQMMQVLIPAVGKPLKPSRFNLAEDRKEEWVRWNQQRDKELKKKN